MLSFIMTQNYLYFAELLRKRVASSGLTRTELARRHGQNIAVGRVGSANAIGRPSGPPARVIFRPKPPPTVGCKPMLHPAQARVKRNLAQTACAR